MTAINGWNQNQVGSWNSLSQVSPSSDPQAPVLENQLQDKWQNCQESPDYTSHCSDQAALLQLRAGAQQSAYVNLTGTPQQKAELNRFVDSDPQLRTTYKKAQDAAYPVKIKFVQDPEVIYGTGRGMGTDPSYHRIDLQDLESARKSDPKLGKVISNGALLHELTEADREAQIYSRPENKNVKPNSPKALDIYGQAHAKAVQVENAYYSKHGMGTRGDGFKIPFSHPLQVAVPYGTHHNVIYTPHVQPVGVEVVKTGR